MHSVQVSGVSPPYALDFTGCRTLSLHDATPRENPITSRPTLAGANPRRLQERCRVLAKCLHDVRNKRASSTADNIPSARHLQYRRPSGSYTSAARFPPLGFTSYCHPDRPKDRKRGRAPSFTTQSGTPGSRSYHVLWILILRACGVSLALVRSFFNFVCASLPEQ